MNEALRLRQTVLSTVPYCDNTHYEGHYQQMLYLMFTLIGYYMDVEVHTPRGRVDVALRTPTTLYIMELKLDATADAACDLPIAKVAINFDSERPTLKDWKIE
ncbi:MAG: PD-(D/E)XK nuclease domain-containing protein [Parabacteroides sp.]|nr:PD-(D/E)XK nuclease domain-containing protein [Parabacteroides sp.]